MNLDTAVALFLKPPIPGLVKTRLAKEIGSEKACSIYKKIAGKVISEVRLTGMPLAIFFDGNDESLLPVEWRDAASVCLPQKGDNIGERMAEAFRNLFYSSYKRVLLAGTDIPGIDSEYLNNAAESLGNAGMVIGPAHDGGYCLIGFTAECFDPVVFEAITWSTELVMQQTLERCEGAGLKPILLGKLRDIDTVEDIQEECLDLTLT